MRGLKGTFLFRELTPKRTRSRSNQRGTIFEGRAVIEAADRSYTECELNRENGGLDDITAVRLKVK